MWTRRGALCLLLGGIAIAAMPGLPDIHAQERQGVLLPLQDVLARISERYRGRAIAADLVSGRANEPTDLVYEIRWLTPGNAVLRIRMDAVGGGFLEIDGRGQTEARKRS